MSIVNDLYRLFCDLFPVQAGEIKDYRADGRHGILMHTYTGLVYRFTYDGPNNYILRKGTNR